jgi:hypothetical protein
MSLSNRRRDNQPNIAHLLKKKLVELEPSLYNQKATLVRLHREELMEACSIKASSEKKKKKKK